MMQRRETKGAPSADLLVCFPSRAHLKLMPPKSISSPARPSDTNMRHHNYHHHNHNHNHNHQHRLLKKSSTRKGGGAGGRTASPLLWSTNKQMGSEITDTEPTSPKVTCAGQIKVRSKTGSCKNWQSVMEEIERIHNSKQHKKRSSWMETLGLKKEVMQFLTCLRSIRFDFRCFGSFTQSDIITTDDEEEEEDEDEKYQENHTYVEGNETSSTMFSKWFMVLQENQNNGFHKEENKEQESSLDDQVAVPPPANALLLMRCRSAPAKSWLEANYRVEQNEEHIENDDDDDEEEEEECKREEEVGKRKNLKCLMEEESRKMKENLVVMKYDTDFYKLSCDIAKETWIVGGMKDSLSRSRSWKR